MGTRVKQITRAAVLAAAFALGAGATVHAQSAPTPLSAAGDMRAALRRLGEGRDVEIVLANGKSYRGQLGAVGEDTVLLTRIAGKELYDVLIDLDEVTAVELRVRSN